MLDQLPFKRVVVFDTEYRPVPGDLPDPVHCVVYKELRSGTAISQWTGDGGGQSPYGTGPTTLYIAHYGVAECLAHIALGRPLPIRFIDTYVEARVLRNGLSGTRYGLTDVAGRYGIATISEETKGKYQKQAASSERFSDPEKARMLRYCLSDVETTAETFLRMLPEILAPKFGLQHALIRGRYMIAAALMQYAGIPVDVELLRRLCAHWPALRQELIKDVDPGRYDCYVNGSFNDSRFAQLLTRMGLAHHWPRTEFGRLSTAQKVFKAKSELHPELQPLYELKQTLDKMKSFDLAIGKDGRHRAESLSPFATRTGRNAPNGFAFALARWTRHVIKPGPGMAIVYSDYTSQEIYNAAMLSRDPKMIEAIGSGDPYMYFAKATGLAPPDATKYTHADLRNKLKPFILGMGYGMLAKGIANKVGTSLEEAKYVLLPKHHGLFRVYWGNAFSRVYTAVDRKHVRSRFGWHMHVTAETKYTSLLNHPIQTAGADVLRLACIGLTEIGIKVVAPVHDAVLTECRIEEIDEHVETVQRIMRLAAKVGVGIEIPVESAVTRWPDRYHEAKGSEMFQTIVRLLVDLEQRNGAPNGVEPSVLAA